MIKKNLKNVNLIILIIDYYAKKKRSFKNIEGILKGVVLSLIIAYLFCTCYFIIEFSLFSEYKKRAEEVIPLLNKTFQIRGSLYVSLNGAREYFHNEHKYIHHKSTYKFFWDYFKETYDRSQELENVIFYNIISNLY